MSNVTLKTLSDSIQQVHVDVIGEKQILDQLDYWQNVTQNRQHTTSYQVILTAHILHQTIDKIQKLATFFKSYNFCVAGKNNSSCNEVSQVVPLYLIILNDAFPVLQEIHILATFV